MGSKVSMLDTGFGPQLAGRFDFTLRFEDIFFTIVPSIVAVLAVFIYVYHILRSSPQLAAGALLWAKEAFAGALVAIQIANIALWATKEPEYRTSVTLAGAALSIAEAVSVTFIIYTKHRYSYRQSTFLSLFLSITLLLDIAKAYSAFNRPGSRSIAGLYIADVVLKLVLIIMEEVPKRASIIDEDLRTNLGRENSAGFWNRSFFCWINRTLLRGYRTSLTVEDLSDLGPEFQSEDLFHLFEPYWNKVAKSTKLALAKACTLTFCWAFFRIIVPRLAHIGFNFAQPFLLLRVVREVGAGSISSDTSGGLIGATALIYIGICVTQTHYQHYSYQLTTKLRGAITTAVYEKMLRLSQEELEKSAAVTLVSTDVAAMERLVARFHDLWASVVEVGLGIYILATMIGPACVLILGPAVVAATISSLVAKRMGVARLAWNEKIETRVAKTSNILAQLKSVKMMGLTPPMSSSVQNLRNAEIKTSLTERRLRVVLHALNAVTVGLTPVVAVAGAVFWTKANDNLTAAEIFAILAVVNIVADPLGVTLVAIPFIVNSFASMLRIQRFLCLEEQTDPRQPMRQSNESNEATNSSKQSPNALNCMIRVTDVTVASSTSGTVFRDAQLELKQGSTTMIWGPVGCGKTTLLKTILGEVMPESGHVEAVSMSIGYCDQSAWLLNISIRDNIIGQCTFDLAWYTRVVFACALDLDFAALINGDQTMAGTGGLQLSGGQKQRVALARAMYARPPMVVLDDVLSAVDKETTALIMTRLFGEPGLLRSLGTTVVMTTNTLHHLKMADTIYTIKQDGTVHQITYGDDTDLVKEIAEPEPTSENEQDSGVSEKKDSEPPTVTATKEDDNQRTRGDLSLYTYYLGSAGAAVLFVWAITIALAAASEKMPMVYVRIWYQNDPSNKLYFVGYAVLGVASIGFTCITTLFFYHLIVANTSMVLHKRLLTSVMGASLKFISDTDAGSILNRFSQDMTMIAQDLPQDFQDVAYMVFATIADIGILSSASKYTAAVIPFFVIVLYGIQYFYLRTSRQLRILELEVRAPLYTLFTETSNGIQHIRAFGWQRAFSREHIKRLDYSQKPYYYLFCIQRWLNLTLSMSTAVIAIVLVTFSLNFASVTSDSAIGLAMLNLVTFSTGLAYLVQIWVHVEAALGAISRVRSFCRDTPQESGVEPAADAAQEMTEKSESLQGRIEFDDVCASYNPDGKESEKVLDNVSVVIEQGQKVGISGRTGSGKSSFLLVLLSMLNYTGSVKIGGRELRTIPRHLLRSQITTLTQDGIELPGSIRLNIDPFHPDESFFVSDDTNPAVSDNDMIQSLKQVGLWERIEAAGGLDADMQKTRLSKGQKQLFSLARAVLRTKSTSAKIVLVDEATSSLDEDTERRVQEVIDVAFADCTVITVSHRLHAFERMDLLLKVDAGKITEDVKPDDGVVSSS